MMVDASLKDIRVIRRINLSTRASERGSVLAEKLNVFLRYVSRFLGTDRSQHCPVWKYAPLRC